MTKRIFRSICLISLAILVVAMALIIGSLYTYFMAEQSRQLRAQVALAAIAVEQEGMAYFESLDADELHLSWIAVDGTVLADTAANAAQMGNHLDREEIREALNSGHGESARYSDTLTQRQIYVAIRLADGSVLRGADAFPSLLALLAGILPQMLITLSVALVLAFLLALYESRRLVKPLNNLNLDDPLHTATEAYDELAPLLLRIASQQAQLRAHGEELRRSRDEFSAVTEGLSDGLILFNEQRVVISINPAASKLMPHPIDRLHEGRRPWAAGRHVSDLTPALGLESLLAAALAAGPTETTVCLNNLSYRLHADPVVLDGETVGFVVLIVNITEQVQNEQSRREFTANVSHELKTPMHSIAGCAELLANGMVAPEDVPQFAGQIYSESHRMMRLLEDIIRLSHLDEGGDDLLGAMTPVDLREIAEAAVDSLRPMAEEAGIKLAMRMDAAEPYTVYGIPQQLTAIILNLLSNGIKYNRAGGTVAVSLRHDSASPTGNTLPICLTVADTGIGIPPEHHSRIFERFYRVDKSHSKEVGGTGLGLSIVKHAVRLHGGRIDLQSRPGEGTTITIHLPGYTPSASEAHETKGDHYDAKS